MEEKKTKKRHNATVTFSRKEQKEEMLQYLNSSGRRWEDQGAGSHV